MASARALPFSRVDEAGEVLEAGRHSVSHARRSTSRTFAGALRAAQSLYGPFRRRSRGPRRHRRYRPRRPRQATSSVRGVDDVEALRGLVPGAVDIEVGEVHQRVFLVRAGGGAASRIRPAKVGQVAGSRAAASSAEGRAFERDPEPLAGACQGEDGGVSSAPISTPPSAVPRRSRRTRAGASPVSATAESVRPGGQRVKARRAPEAFDGHDDGVARSQARSREPREDRVGILQPVRLGRPCDKARQAVGGGGGCQTPGRGGMHLSPAPPLDLAGRAAPRDRAT